MSLFTADMLGDESCQSKPQVHVVAKLGNQHQMSAERKITTDTLA